MFPAKPGEADSPTKGRRTGEHNTGASPHPVAARAAAALGVLALMAVLGVVILSPTFVGFMIESKGYSDRAGALSRERAVGSNALHPGAVATHATPIGSVWNLRREMWPYTDQSSCSVYTDPIVLALAVMAMVWGRRNGFHRWLLAGSWATLLLVGAVSVGAAARGARRKRRGQVSG